MSEHWDVTDEHGRPTGETYLRGAPGWPPGRFHVVVATCVFRGDGALLLTQRAAGKEFALCWEFPGGSAFAGETSVAAARRELREETGLVVYEEALSLAGRFTESTALLDMYVAIAPEPAAVIPDDSEVAAYEWVRPGEVLRRLETGAMADPWNARLEALWTPLGKRIAELSARS